MSDIDIILKYARLENSIKDTDLALILSEDRFYIHSAHCLEDFDSVNEALTYVKAYKDGVMYG